MDVNKVVNLGTVGRHNWLSLNPLGEILTHDDYELIYT